MGTSKGPRATSSNFKVPNWLKPIFYFLLIVLVLAWEGYKLLGAPGGKFLRGTAPVKVGDERVPGLLYQSISLCEVELPIQADDRAMPHVNDMVVTILIFSQP